MGRGLEMLSYGLVATVLVVASLYGLVHYAESPDPRMPARTAGAPPPWPAHAVPSPAIPAAPVHQADNVVRTATRTYYLAPSSQSQVDVNLYNTLRDNCYANARNNGEGDFPMLQQAACNRFASFARSRGWDTGPLPAYAAPRPVERGEQVMIIGQGDPVDGGLCAMLYEREQQIEAAMRAGYQEPQGNWLRAELRDVEEKLGKGHCPRR